MGNGEGSKSGEIVCWLENASNVESRKNVFQRYKGRHIVLAVAVVLLCAYYALREVPAVADFATRYIAHPWQRFFGRIFDIFPFSIAELLCVVVGLGIFAYLVFSLYKIIREPKKLQRAYAALIEILAGALATYALFCWLWGVSFYSQTFAELSGIETGTVSVEELKEVAIYFAEEANAASGAVDRDENGLYVCDVQKTLDIAPTLYSDLPEGFEFLNGPGMHPKSMASSYLMSLTNFTGVFFPLTGEANINMYASDCYFPTTVAHELAHQRGVTKEQDANFTAVLVCMESGDADFTYSGALLAYADLASSLKQVSYEDWEDTCYYLGESARRDLRAIGKCWEKSQTPVTQITATAYGEFLQNQGQELGMGSYGDYVDLLVAYYGEMAHKTIGSAFSGGYGTLPKDR